MTDNYFPCVEKAAQSLNDKQRVYLLCCLVSMVVSKDNCSGAEAHAWSVFGEMFEINEVLIDGIDSAVSVLSGMITFDEC